MIISIAHFLIFSYEHLAIRNDKGKSMMNGLLLNIAFSKN